MVVLFQDNSSPMFTPRQCLKVLLVTCGLTTALFFLTQKYHINYASKFLATEQELQPESYVNLSRSIKSHPDTEASVLKFAGNNSATVLSQDDPCSNEFEYNGLLEQLDLEKSAVVPPYKTLGASTFYTHKNNHKLGYCVNLKAGYTLLTLIFGYLSDPKKCNITENWSGNLVDRCNILKTKENTIGRAKATRESKRISQHFKADSVNISSSACS